MISIDDRALVHNAKFFDKMIGNSVLCGVLKCDAYGHGLVTCATILADYLQCVALSNVAEADSIKHIGLPTLILLPLDERDTMHAVSCGYTMTVDSVATASRVAQYGNSAHVHIKVDSGMCRLGVNSDMLLQVLEILSVAGVAVDGIYSHCAYASNSQYTQLQYACFMHCCNITSCKLGYMPMRHFANSEATLASDQYHLDMVRVGLGLYGYGSSELLPVKQLSGRVLATKTVLAGSKVSYDNTYVVQADTNIAVVDIGYWQGLRQGISSVMIGNQPCKVLGKVCMGMIIVDIGKNIVKQFDEVAIIGNNNSIPYSSDISIYELLCATKDTMR